MGIKPKPVQRDEEVDEQSERSTARRGRPAKKEGDQLEMVGVVYEDTEEPEQDDRGAY